MILLERVKPRILIKIELLKCRLDQDHPKLDLIHRDYHSFKTGYQGEVNLDYYFSLMDHDKFNFYHGLRLFNGESYFQIDTLLVTSHYILPVEIKKLSGTVTYDKKTNQFTQNGIPILNPFSQVKLQKLQFVDWLQKNKFPPIPVDFLIAMANPSTKFECPNGYPDQFWKMCYGHDVIEKIKIHEKSFRIEHFTSKELKRLKRLLLKEHTPLEVDILAKYGISKDEILTGVFCPSCKTISMKYQHGIWVCQNCKYKSKDEHVKAIQEYFLLIGSSITNQQFRQFTHIDSRQIASRLLAAMKLPTTGTKGGRIYYPQDSKPNISQTEPAITTQKASTDSKAPTKQ